MKIAVCQFNPIIGDLKGNAEKILTGYKRAVNEGADLAIFPELFLCGYPPLDLVEKKEFRDAVKKAAEEIASHTSNTGLIFGSITEDFEFSVGTGVYNSAVLCYDGKIQFIQSKTLIPNYDVFDEVRYFEPAKNVSVYEFKGERLGISICEDIWNDADYWKHRRYQVDPIQKLVDENASVLINISASPYAYGKRKEKYNMLSVLTRNDKMPLVYACCVGTQTELIFDGGSMCFNSSGKLEMLGKTFQEDFFIYDTEKQYNKITKIEDSFEEEVLNALILGLKDYANKTGFKKALIGLSGGIDSAIVAYIAVRAFGVANVHVVLMPSKYSSHGSVGSAFRGLNEDVTEENLQSRIRGLYLMGLSNKHGYLLCTTGNKSEIATGYATLYGDMCGALAVIGDVYKTQIYKIASYINHKVEIIPKEIIDKAPSAELRPDQTDQDSLPPYDLLDKILKMYLEEQKEFQEITESIGDPVVVKKVLRLVDLNEFKRKQAAPILRVSTKAFGYGRRFPIVQGWRK